MNERVAVSVKKFYTLPMPIRNILLTLCVALVLLAVPGPSSGAEPAVFLSIIDGDSMNVQIAGRARELRLIGIDAPEWGQEYGTRAKTFALKFCYGQKLTVEFDVEKRDRYGRYLGYIYVGNKMLNEELVRSGLALAIKYKPNTRHHARLVRAQKEAKRTKQGFWLYGGLKKTPYEWRKLQEKK